MNAVCVEDLLEVVEAMKGAAADESISASKASDKLERIAHLATEAAYSAVIDKLEEWGDFFRPTMKKILEAEGGF